MKRAIALGVLVCAIVRAASAAGPTLITYCGYPITKAGTYALAGNLACSSDGVLIQTSNVTLLLNGYTISGQGPSVSSGEGVVAYLGTTNVSILGPGTIKGFNGGLSLRGSSSVVANVTATQNLLGFSIPFALTTPSGMGNNIFKGNTANFNTFIGFSIFGDGGNVLKGNDASNNGGSGFGFAQGTGNEIRGNTANANSQDGIAVAGGR